MIKRSAVVAIMLGLTMSVGPTVKGQSVDGPDTVVVSNGAVVLRGLLWRPRGAGPFPAILLNHGSGRTPEELARLGPYENQAQTMGPVFARHGYVLFFLFRRGVGLSVGEGASAIDTMNAELAAHGQEARNALQLRLLEGRELSDAMAASAALRARADVDARRIALVGHSFGGSLTVLQAARDSTIRAVVVFSGAGYSWDKSPELRASLLAAETRMRAPAFFIHAANDYSLHPGIELDARLAQLGKLHRLKIYPPIGRTPDDGHAFPLLGVDIWEPDVFAFLDEYLKH
jgi:carboxymethylenebutenolidase